MVNKDGINYQIRYVPSYLGDNYCQGPYLQCIISLNKDDKIYITDEPNYQSRLIDFMQYVYKSHYDQSFTQDIYQDIWSNKKVPYEQKIDKILLAILEK